MSPKGEGTDAVLGAASVSAFPASCEKLRKERKMAWKLTQIDRNRVTCEYKIIASAKYFLLTPKWRDIIKYN